MRFSVSKFRRDLNASKSNVFLYAVVFAALIYETLSGTSYSLFLWGTVLVYAIAAIGQDWLIGKAGQISIGGAALLGVGSFTTALTRGTVFHWFPIPLVLSMVVGAFIGVIVAVPALRVSGIYLVLTTLAFQEVFQFWSLSYQGEREGFYPPSMRIGDVNFGTPRLLFAVIAVCLLLVLQVLRNLYRSSPGNIWRAIHEDPLASQVIGINVERWRLLAFVGSSAVTALAGSLYAYLIGLVSSSTYTLTLGISLVVMVFLGGVGSPIGVFLGAAAITFLPVGLEHLEALPPAGSTLSNWLISNQGTELLLVYGLVLILILKFEPDGLAGISRRVGRRSRRLVEAFRGRKMGTPMSDSPARLERGHDDLPALKPPVPSHAGSETLLNMLDVSVTYANGAQGIRGVNLSIEEESIVAIVGRNGAGKSTTLLAIAGFLPSDRVRIRGSVTLGGNEILGSQPRKTGKSGVILVPERFKVFPSLTVQEHFKADGISSRREAECLERFSALSRFAKTKGGLLSGGERQLLGIALAVARRPKLLLVDELSLGLSPLATQNILTELKRVHDEEGLSILLVDQAASAMVDVVDYYYLLEGGTVVGEGNANQIGDAEIRAAVMGE
jgi:branched-chain amino acid transport system permease protein